MYYAVIIAGGSGTRLWPLSRRSRSKQSLKLVGERTMFQHAVDRLAPLFRPEQIYRGYPGRSKRAVVIPGTGTAFVQFYQ